LDRIKFIVNNGIQQTIASEVEGLPNRIGAVIVKFSLTNINIRRLYASLHLSQSGSSNKVNLTDYFFVGPELSPPIGQSTEIIFPWDRDLPHKLELEVTLAQQSVASSSHAALAPHLVHTPLPIGYAQSPFGANLHHFVPHHPHQAPQAPNVQADHISNPYSYASIEVVGYIFE